MNLPSASPCLSSLSPSPHLGPSGPSVAASDLFLRHNHTPDLTTLSRFHYLPSPPATLRQALLPTWVRLGHLWLLLIPSSATTTPLISPPSPASTTSHPRPQPFAKSSPSSTPPPPNPRPASPSPAPPSTPIPCKRLRR